MEDGLSCTDDHLEIIIFQDIDTQASVRVTLEVSMYVGNRHASCSTASVTELIAFRGHPRGKVAKPSDIVEALHPSIVEKHIRQPTYGLPDEPLSPR